MDVLVVAPKKMQPDQPWAGLQLPIHVNTSALFASQLLLKWIMVVTRCFGPFGLIIGTMVTPS
jgi:hypothetical protein